MTNERLGELEEFPVDLTDIQFDAAVQKAHALKPAAEINETVNNQVNLESMILANTNMQSYAVADVLYDFDGFALTNADGTREFKNKALHSDTPNGKLFSGNPLDFQGSQYIKLNSFTLTESKMTIFHSGIFNSVGNQHIINLNYAPVIMNIGSNLVVYIDDTSHVICSLNDGDYYQMVTIINGTELKSFVIANNIIHTFLGTCTEISTNRNSHAIGATFAGSSFSDTQLTDVGIIDGRITEDEAKRYFAEPEKFVTDYGTKPELKGEFVTDFSGDSDYISNMCEHTIGAKNADIDGIEKYTNGIGNIVSVDENNICHIHCETPTANPWEPFCGGEVLNPTAGELYYVKATIKVTSGTLHLRQWEIGDENLEDSNVYYNEELGIGTYIKEIIANFRSNGKNRILFDGTLQSDFDANVEYEYYKLEGVHQIQGYNDTNRSNFIEDAKGYQHLLVKRNDIGFTTGLSKDIQADGIGYLDAEITRNLKEAQTITIAVEQIDNQVGYTGCADSLSSRLAFGFHTESFIAVHLGNVYPTFPNIRTDNIAIVSIVLNGRIGESKVVVNGEDKGLMGETAFDAVVSKFYLGSQGDTKRTEIGVKYFNIAKYDMSIQEVQNLHKLIDKKLGVL